jgi:hypothetical protein
MAWLSKLKQAVQGRERPSQVQAPPGLPPTVQVGPARLPDGYRPIPADAVAALHWHETAVGPTPEPLPRLTHSQAADWLATTLNRLRFGQSYPAAPGTSELQPVLRQLAAKLVQRPLKPTSALADALFLQVYNPAGPDAELVPPDRWLRLLQQAQQAGILNALHRAMLAHTQTTAQPWAASHGWLAHLEATLNGPAQPQFPPPHDALGQHLRIWYGQLQTERPALAEHWRPLLLALLKAPAVPAPRTLNRLRKQVQLLDADVFRERVTEWLHVVLQQPRLAVQPATGTLLAVAVQLAAYQPSGPLAHAVAELARRALIRQQELPLVLSQPLLRVLAQLPDTTSRRAWAELRPLLPKAPAALVRVYEAAEPPASHPTEPLATFDALFGVVPSFGLHPRRGYSSTSVGPHVAELVVPDAFTVELRWRKGKRAVKARPPEVAALYAAEWHLLRQQQKRMQHTLNALRQQAEGLFWVQLGFTLGQLHERWLHHPVLRVLAEGTIWRLGPEPDAPTALPLNGGIRWVDAHGQHLFRPRPETPVQPWHPLSARPEEHTQWAEVLATLGIRQPLLQVHRPVFPVPADTLSYPLTTPQPVQLARFSRYLGHWGARLVPAKPGQAAYLHWPVPGTAYACRLPLADATDRAGCAYPDALLVVPNANPLQPLPFGQVPAVQVSEAIHLLRLALQASATTPPT